MGKRGPPPTPTKILKLRGSYHAEHRAGEPEPEVARPDRPEWLCELAAVAWDQIVPELDAMNILGRIDGNALARYCTLWARWRECDDKITKYGDSFAIKNEKGETVGFHPFPHSVQANKLCQLLSRLEGEFGMTPSSRSRIQVPGNKPKQEDEREYRLA